MALARPSPRWLTRSRAFTAQVRSYSAPGDGNIPASKKKYIPTSGTYPLGFKAGSAHVGVKPSNTRFDDLALIASDTPCAAAAVFTTNKFQAAPVTVSRDMLSKRKGDGVRAVVVNSGCANAVTGKGGIQDAVRMGQETDKCFIEDSNGEDDGQGSRSIVMSTGVIGQRLPIDKIVTKLPHAYYKLGDTHDHWLGAAKAICTTDTFPKLVSKTFTLPGSQEQYHIAGMTKGAGMIHPNMATMLSVITTDASVAPDVWRGIMQRGAANSFNQISVDGDTSTNDTVLGLASGLSGGETITDASSEAAQQLEAATTALLQGLAKSIAWDGEGATCLIEVQVAGTTDDESARKVAKSVVASSLVKAAIFGHDPNWGRIACAAGYAGVSYNANDVDISLGEIELMSKGQPLSFDAKAASKYLTDVTSEHGTVYIRLSVGSGPGRGSAWGCDLSYDYVKINAEYTT